MEEPLFRVGGRVRLRAEPITSGVVTAVHEPYGDGRSYEVFFGPTDTRVVNERGLEAVPVDERLYVLPHQQFLIQLLLAKLETPLSNLFYSYLASRTQFEPYQFKPVLKYLDAPTEGLLIADEVGLGKTIEAAILHQELKARSTLSRVLVICPAGLRVKWRTELLTRFDESFTILDRKDVFEDFRLYGERSGRHPLNGIVGLETMRARVIQAALDESDVRYDLVIIDEAHHVRTAGRLSNTLGERMSELTDNLLLLTATPLQTSQRDLFNLLRLLDESMFDNYEDFLAQLEPNRNLNAAVRALRERPPNEQEAIAQLRGVARLYAGRQVTVHPNYQAVLDRLDAGLHSRDERIQVQRQIDAMNVLAPIYTRTRKRDVANIAKREPHMIPVPITPAELRFYNAVFAHARAQAQATSEGGWIPGFAGMMRERQAASCLAATREYLMAAYGDVRTPLLDEGEEPEATPESAVIKAGPGPKESLRELIDAGSELPERDSKFEIFIAALREVLADNEESKVIVFSYFRRTLDYLDRQLRNLGIPRVMITGGVKPVDRAVIIDRFRDDKGVRVMLSSEVGAEGLDFQFADTMFNYDLPWNPMRVEQRIGRIDRYGQTREKVRIYSFFLEETIEERILERLYLRIGIFEDSVGDLEPILGPLTHELTREIFMGSLSAEQEQELAERIADRIAFLRKEQEALEERQSELLGQDVLLMQAIDDTVKSGRYISAQELRAITSAFVSEVGTIASLDWRPDEQTVMLRPDPRLADAVEEVVYGNQDRRAVSLEFIARLNQSALIPATYDGEVAARLRRLELFNLRHPLTQAAVGHFKRASKLAMPIGEIRVEVPAIDAATPGSFAYFALFRVVTSGAQPQTTLRAIVLMPDGNRLEALEPMALRLLQDGDDAMGLSPWTTEDRTWVLQTARGHEAIEADRLEAEIRERNDGVLAVRKATLERTFNARIAKRERQLADATNDRIARLRSGELRNTRNELKRRLDELEMRREVGVSFSPVAIGRMVFGDIDGSGVVRERFDPPVTPDGETMQSPIDVSITDLGPYREPAPAWRPRENGPG